MRQIILLALAVVAGIVAFLTSKTYLENQEKKILAKYQEVEVIIAKEDIPIGTKIDFNLLDHATMVGSPAVAAAVQATRDNALRIQGFPVQRHIKKGEPIFWADVVSSVAGEYMLSSMLRKGDVTVDAQTFKRVQRVGMRAISIPVDLVASVTQMVIPGDRVDIIGTFTFPSAKPDPTLDTVTLTILQDVLVLATGKATTRDLSNPALPPSARSGAGLAYSTVTLEVSPQEAEMLAFAIRRGGGNLMLSLRHREDITIVWKPQSINFEYLEKHLAEFNVKRQERMIPPRTPPDEER
jgi:pilus assembly protein CpaB